MVGLGHPGGQRPWATVVSGTPRHPVLGSRLGACLTSSVWGIWGSILHLWGQELGQLGSINGTGCTGRGKNPGVFSSNHLTAGSSKWKASYQRIQPLRCHFLISLKDAHDESRKGGVNNNKFTNKWIGFLHFSGRNVFFQVQISIKTINTELGGGQVKISRFLLMCQAWAARSLGQHPPRALTPICLSADRNRSEAPLWSSTSSSHGLQWRLGYQGFDR